MGWLYKDSSLKSFPSEPFTSVISGVKENSLVKANYVVEENLCELNNRTKEARPEHFRSDPARVYLRRLSNRGMYKTVKKPY